MLVAQARMRTELSEGLRELLASPSSGAQVRGLKGGRTIGNHNIDCQRRTASHNLVLPHEARPNHILEQRAERSCF